MQATPNFAGESVGQILADPTGAKVCRYSDTAFPEPAEYVPQQIHLLPASALAVARPQLEF